MIGSGKKQIEELEEQLRMANNEIAKLRQQNSSQRVTLDENRHELKQLRHAERHTVSSEEADSLKQQLIDSKNKHEQLTRDQGAVNSQAIETIKQLKQELSTQTKLARNAIATAKRLRLKAEKSKARSA